MKSKVPPDKLLPKSQKRFRSGGALRIFSGPFIVSRSLHRLVFFGILMLTLSALQADQECEISTSEAPVASTPDLCKGRTVKEALLSEETGEPNFSNVDDILQGERELLLVNDLVFGNPTARLASQTQTDPIHPNLYLSYLLTGDDNVAEVQDQGEKRSNTKCFGFNGPYFEFVYGIPTPIQTQTARMFNLDRDLVVTYGPDVDEFLFYCTNQGGVKNFSFQVFDPQHEISVPVRLRNTNAVSFQQSAVADFDRDGFDDVLFAAGRNSSDTHPRLLVLSAKDPNDPSAGVALFLIVVDLCT